MSSALALTLVLLKVLAGHAAADNPAGEETDCNGNHGQVQTDGNLCLTQSGAMCTLAFSCGQSTLDDSVSGSLFVYNNECACINTFSEYDFASSGTKSEFPFTIATSNQPAPGLLYDTEIDFTDCSASPQVQWSYNGASFDQSACDCQEDNSGLTGITACRCPFPC